MSTSAQPREAASKDTDRSAPADPVGGPDAHNEVLLRGRLSRDPEERVLPSGDVMWSFRVVVARVPVRAGSRQTVDVIECAAWSARTRRSVATWRTGDVVELTGAIRRRFFRAAGAPASRVEVEMLTGRRVRRATPA